MISMKKTLPFLIACLATSTTTFAAKGTTPICGANTKGHASLVIVNKDPIACLDFSKVLATKEKRPIYCIDRGVTFDGGGLMACDDATNAVILRRNTNASMSIGYPNEFWSGTGSISYGVSYYKDGKFGISPQLVFRYSQDHDNHGQVSNNCAQVFGSDLTCTVSESGNLEHKVYTLTISR